MLESNVDLQRTLLAAARQVATRAYVPYSQFPVGAALYFDEGAPIVTGCNVENASYPLGLCAERTAIVKAVSEGLLKPRMLAVVAPKAQPCYPCGACRQVLHEFAPDLTVVFEGADGEPILLPLRELLPYSFSNADLPAPIG